MNKQEKDKVCLLLAMFLISMFWLYINSAPGIVVSFLDRIYLLIGFIIPYIIFAGILKYEMKGVKDNADTAIISDKLQKDNGSAKAEGSR